MAALAAFATVKVMVKGNEKRIDAISVRLDEESKQRKEGNDFALMNFYTKSDIDRQMDMMNNRFDSMISLMRETKADIKHLGDKVDKISG